MRKQGAKLNTTFDTQNAKSAASSYPISAYK